MAILQQPVTHSNPFSQQIGDTLAPEGTYTATILEIRDEFEVIRQKFQSQETEKVDLTCFLFGFQDSQGQQHRVASRRMKISGNEKSALFGFLKSLLGRAPSYGWDYCSLKGSKCLLTVEHIKRKVGSGEYASIASLSPLPDGYGKSGQIPPQPQPTGPSVPPAAALAPSVTTTDDDVPF